VRARTAQRGFTLIEMMVSLVLFSLLVGGMLTVAISMTAAFRDEELTASTESTVRLSMDMLGDAVRGASPGVPTGGIQHVGAQCGSQAIVVTNNTKNDTGTPKALDGTDQLTIVFAYGSVTTALRSAYTTGTTTVTVGDASELAAGDSLLLANLEDKGHVVEVTAVNGNTLTLKAQACSSLALPTGGYPIGTVVMRVLRARFFIADMTDGGPLTGLAAAPALWMDPDADGPAAAEPLAEGVEDLQIAVGIDANGDGALTETAAATGDDEWSYNLANETLPAGTIRAIRVTLLARAVAPLDGVATFLRPPLEDHAASGTADLFRRRTLRSVIEVRNLGGSPP
jgi:prepilin-type N-terminal cleavage/methylation domain-containing protein